MEDELLSLLIWCTHDSPVNSSNAASIRVVRVDTGEEVALKDGSYLVRVSRDSGAAMTRCFVRHIGSGHEVYFQSGQGLPDFVRTCLIREGEAPPSAARASETSASGSEVSGEAEVQDEQDDGTVS